MDELLYCADQVAGSLTDIDDWLVNLNESIRFQSQTVTERETPWCKREAVFGQCLQFKAGCLPSVKAMVRLASPLLMWSIGIILISCGLVCCTVCSDSERRLNCGPEQCWNHPDEWLWWSWWDSMWDLWEVLFQISDLHFQVFFVMLWHFTYRVYHFYTVATKLHWIYVY